MRSMLPALLLVSCACGLCVERAGGRGLRRPYGGAPRLAATDEVLEKTIQRLSEVAESARKAWVDRGWQVRKRAGQWLPEVVPAPGSDWAAIAEALPDGEEGGAIERGEDGRGWLAAGSNSARVLSSPQSDAAGREVAVADAFSRFLLKPEIARNYDRMANGNIVFANEAALSTAVVAFSLEVLRELAVASRALVRYIYDLEGELAAADEGAVRLRAQVSEAEAEAEDRRMLAAREEARAAALKDAADGLAVEAKQALEASAAAEKRAEAASVAVERLEGAKGTDKAALDEARATALALEERLVAEERESRRIAEELKAAQRRSENAERLATAAQTEKSAVEGVVSAMEKRALAAEAAAHASAERLEQALAESLASERRLNDALQSLDEQAGDTAPDLAAAADAADAVKELKELTTTKVPALSTMRKAELVAEFQARGLDPRGLKVPQLRTKLRSERRREVDPGGGTIGC